MNRQAHLKKLERALVRKLRAAGHTVERPMCYSEARYDTDGHLLPMTPDELRRVVGARATQQQDRNASFLERYQQPTVAWPNGKSNLIKERVQRATGTLQAQTLNALQAFKLDWSNADPASLPIEFQFALFIAGLMDTPPSEVTQAALAVFHPLGLFSLLSIDPPVFEPRRRTRTPERKLKKRQLREYEALLPVLREYGGRVIEAHILETVLTTLQQLLGARVVMSLSDAENEHRETRRHFDMITVCETGWTTTAVEYRRSKVVKLVGGLRAAEPNMWPLSRIAALLLASEDDWNISPCPRFFAKYRDRADALEDLLKKDLTRSEAVPLLSEQSKVNPTKRRASKRKPARTRRK